MTIFVTMQDAVDAKKDKEQEQIQDLIYGTFFRVDGKIRVVGQPHYCNYYPEDGGQPNIIFNVQVIEQESMPFVAGVREGQTEPEVLWIDKSRLVDDKRIATPFASHAGGHQYASLDPLWVDTRQLIELRISPTLGQLKVNIAPGRYAHNYQEYIYSGIQEFDLSTYQPNPSLDLKRAVGVYLLDNNPIVVSGPIVARPVLPIPEPIWPSGIFKLALIILYSLQDYIDYEDIKSRKLLYSSTQDDYPNSIAAIHYFENCW
jgi:hypothetical protein